MDHVQLFISAVSNEFRGYRDAIRNLLQRHNVTVHVQEDFIATGTETLDKLDSYISSCTAVIHLAGDMTGAWAEPATTQRLQARYPDLGDRLMPLKPSLEQGNPPLSYTQWEAYLAVYHRKVLLIAVPEANAPRDPKYLPTPTTREAQQDHLKRLEALGRFPEIRFGNSDQLVSAIAVSALLDLLAGKAQASALSLWTFVGCLLAIDGIDTLFSALAKVMAGGDPGQSLLWASFAAAELAAGACTILGWRAARWVGLFVSALGALLAGQALLAADSWSADVMARVWAVHQMTLAFLLMASALAYAMPRESAVLTTLIRGRRWMIWAALVLFVVWPAAISILDSVLQWSDSVVILRSIAVLAVATACVVFVAYQVVNLRETPGPRRPGAI